MLSHIVLLGPPGCGKGTLAKSLNTNLNIAVVGLGDIIRNEIKSNSLLGLKIKDYVNKGRLVPDSIIIDLFSSYLIPSHFESSLILDGYPRTVDQATNLIQIYASKSIKLNILYFVTSFDVIKERITGRISCTKCGYIFHVKFNPPKINNICDKCNSLLFSRSDDLPSVIETRYKTYINEISPVIDLFSDKLIHVNADLPANDVYKSVLNLLSL